MNATTILYVGIDVSKYKSDVCIKDKLGNDLIKRLIISNKKADLGHLYETIAGLDPIVSQSGRFENKSGKHHYSALNAVAAKLLRITYWVLKNNKEYQTQPN